MEIFQSNHEGEIVDKIQQCYGKKDGITLGEMQDVAKHVLSVVLDIKYR